MRGLYEVKAIGAKAPFRKQWNHVAVGEKPCSYLFLADCVKYAGVVASGNLLHSLNLIKNYRDSKGLHGFVVAEKFRVAANEPRGAWNEMFEIQGFSLENAVYLDLGYLERSEGQVGVEERMPFVFPSSRIESYSVQEFDRVDFLRYRSWIMDDEKEILHSVREEHLGHLLFVQHALKYWR
jgi:hypothetical protein